MGWIVKKKLTKVRKEREHHIPVAPLFPSLSLLFPESRVCKRRVYDGSVREVMEVGESNAAGLL